MAYVQESPWGAIGRPLGYALAWWLTKGPRERKVIVDKMKDAYEEAQLTGDKSALYRFAQEHPDAVPAFEKATGKDFPAPPAGQFGVDVPPMQGPIAAGGPAQMAPNMGMQAGAPGQGFQQLPGSIMPPAAGDVPKTAEQARMQTPMPWPTTAQGMNVRAMQEGIAGRPLPRALQEPPEAPEGAKVIDVSRMLELYPDATQEEFDAFVERQEIPGRLPTSLGTEVEGYKLTDSMITSLISHFKVSPEDTKHMLTTRVLPPGGLKPKVEKGSKVTLTELQKNWKDVTEPEYEQWARDQSPPGRPPTPPADTEEIKYNFWRLAFKDVAPLTGEDANVVYKQMMDGTYNDATYRTEIQRRNRIQPLRSLLISAVRIKGADSDEVNDLMTLLVGELQGLGIPLGDWKAKKTILEKLKSLLGITSMYASPEDQALETPEDIAAEALRDIR